MSKKASFDSEDSVLNNDVNSYESLRQHTWERCEFCDKTFNTRIANIKHNASHIIIPLLKLTLHQCDECLFHFTSLSELHTHITTKNHKTLQFQNKPRPLSLEYEKILRSIVEKQALVKCHDTLNEVLSPRVNKKTSSNSILVKPTPTLNPKELNSVIESPNVGCVTIYEISSDSDRESPDIPEIPEKGQNRPEKGQSGPEKGQSGPKKGHRSPKMGHRISELETKEKNDKESSPLRLESLNNSLSRSPSPKRELSSPIEPIRSRIMFEDDLEDDDLFEAEEILPDKPYHPPKQNSYIIGNTPYNTSQTNSFIFGSQLCPLKLNGTRTDVVKNGEDECYTKSVHYDELIIPGLCDCRYCGRCFGNRFELIKHECVHMRAKPSRPNICCVCERYIAGNHWALRRHMQKYHPDMDRKLQVRQCNICHFSFHNYRRHVQYYHQLKCGICKRSFDRQELEKHDCIDKYTKMVKNGIGIEDTLTADSYKVIKMCEMCLAFAKNRQNIHYEIIGEHSEVGNRQQCDRCHSLHFEINLVRRKVKFREGTTEFARRKKPLSNQERLKKMQNRLKMVNKMNKC